MSRTCNLPGCERAVSARDMCRQHYRAWMLRQPQLKPLNPDTRQRILDALPGMQSQIVKRSKLAPQTVQRALAKLHDDKELHVGRLKPPTKVGEKWYPVYVLGPGEDAKVSARVKANQHRRNVRAAYRRRCDAAEKAAAVRQTVKTYQWAATLMMGV